MCLSSRNALVEEDRCSTTMISVRVLVKVGLLQRTSRTCFPTREQLCIRLPGYNIMFRDLQSLMVDSLTACVQLLPTLNLSFIICRTMYGSIVQAQNQLEDKCSEVKHPSTLSLHFFEVYAVIVFVLRPANLLQNGPYSYICKHEVYSLD